MKAFFLCWLFSISTSSFAQLIGGGSSGGTYTVGEFLEMLDLQTQDFGGIDVSSVQSLLINLQADRFGNLGSNDFPPIVGYVNRLGRISQISPNYLDRNIFKENEALNLAISINLISPQLYESISRENFQELDVKKLPANQKLLILLPSPEHATPSGEFSSGTSGEVR